MIWQDILMMVGGFIFSVALLPSVLGKEKPARSSCLITGTILTSYVVAMATLGLWLSAGATVLTATMWFVLLLQRRDIWLSKKRYREG